MVGVAILIIIGLLYGIGLGLMSRSGKVGCLASMAVPITAIGYVGWWHGANPELVRSTSGLEYIFVPIPPTLAALFGFAVVFLVRDWLDTRDL